LESQNFQSRNLPAVFAAGHGSCGCGYWRQKTNKIIKMQWIIIVERPDKKTPFADERWNSFLQKAQALVARDPRSRTLLEGCFLSERNAIGTAISGIVGLASQAGMHYRVLETVSCKAANPKLIQIYDPHYPG
jgi:hypothetical protein